MTDMHHDIMKLPRPYHQWVGLVWEVHSPHQLAGLPSPHPISLVGNVIAAGWCCQGVHISKLGICAPLCSHKDPPGKLLSVPLMELIAEHGFKTANEPLLGTQPEVLAHRGLVNINPVSQNVPHPLASQSIGYIKGLGRTSTLMAFLLYCKQHMIDLAAMHPLFHQSLLTIYVWRYACDNKMEETLKNMKISCAGALRKPPHVVAIVSMSIKLMKEGMPDYQELIRRFNQGAPRQFKIQGQKASTMKILLGSMRDTPFLQVLAYNIVAYYNSNTIM